MTISKNEFNTNTRTAEIWNYHLTANGSIISSEKIMDYPVAPWADVDAVSHQMIKLALDSKRWQFGR